MTEKDVAAMSDAEIARNLKRLRGITAFWDEDDRQAVRAMISLLEQATASRSAKG